MNDAPITDFRGEYRWLSNFERCFVMFEGEMYSSSEHAYQAAKTVSAAERKAIQAAASPRDAKRLGGCVKMRADWDAIKVDVMRQILRDKFTRNAHLRTKLILTGNAHLEEGNTWRDTFWGVCGGVGENWLGRLLMQIRSEL